MAKEKKEGKETELKEAKKAESPKYSKYTKIVVIIMAIVLVSIFIIYWLIQESKTFEYKGIKFYKEKEGSLTFYKSLLGYATQSGQSIPFIVKLRKDPRETDKILVEGEIDNIRPKAVFSLSPEIANCSDTTRTMVDFSITLKAFGISTTAATTDKNFSKERNIPLTDCKDAKLKTVIVMKEGNETKIIKTGDCYTIEINNCEISESFEKFILEFIINSITKESF